MVRGVKISFDLESSPLQIKTASTAGSGEQMGVRMYTENKTWIGGVLVQFSSSVKYHIGYCTSPYWITLPVQPPEEVDKTWTIRKTATTLSIECNGVEVLNYQFSDSSLGDCVSKWGGDVVDKILFGSSSDTASDSYRAKPGITN